MIMIENIKTYVNDHLFSKFKNNSVPKFNWTEDFFYGKVKLENDTVYLCGIDGKWKDEYPLLKNINPGNGDKVAVGKLYMDSDKSKLALESYCNLENKNTTIEDKPFCALNKYCISFFERNKFWLPTLCCVPGFGLFFAFSIIYIFRKSTDIYRNYLLPLVLYGMIISVLTNYSSTWMKGPYGWFFFLTCTVSFFVIFHQLYFRKKFKSFAIALMSTKKRFYRHFSEEINSFKHEYAPIIAEDVMQTTKKTATNQEKNRGAHPPKQEVVQKAKEILLLEKNGLTGTELYVKLQQKMKNDLNLDVFKDNSRIRSEISNVVRMLKEELIPDGLTVKSKPYRIEKI